MNEVSARAIPVYGGFEGQFRRVHKADWESVQVHGVAQVYPTRDAAEVAAWRALRAHLCGDIVGTGDRVSGVLSEAEAKFGKLLRGGGKTIEVVRR